MATATATMQYIKASAFARKASAKGKTHIVTVTVKRNRKRDKTNG